mgnify:CR=1 FL=1
MNEVSMYIKICAKHRKETLAAMDWTIGEIKKEYPIWKEAIYADGTIEHGRMQTLIFHEQY